MLAQSPTKRPTQEVGSLIYPQTRRSDHVDQYHGTDVPDPYRWLEDPDSDETKAWVEAENKLTFGFLESIPQRESIKQRLTELWNYERFGLPRRRGDRYFYTRNDGLQNQSVLYVSDGIDGEPRVLIDPNQWAEDGTMALAGWTPSEDGKLLTYGIAAAGSDWREWKVLNVETGEALPDHLKWVKFSGVSWLKDGSGLFYSRYDEPKEGEEFTGVNYYQKLYFHKIGDDQSKDQLVYERSDEKEWGFDGHVTEDARFLIITIWRGSHLKNQIFYKDLTRPDAEVVELLTGFEFEYDFVGNDGDTFWFNTDDHAPLRRVLAIDINQPQREDWHEVIPEAKEVLQGTGLVGERFLALYLKDAASEVRIFDLAGKHVRDVDLPAIGSAEGFGGRRSDRETFYYFSNYTTPGTIYKYDIAAGQSEVFREPTVDFDPNAYETRQVFYDSKDGTRVPMFITHKRGVQLDGSNPMLLYAYGGFNISLTPGFSVSNLVWLERGGIYAVPNLRGGGEYGRDWHEAGMQEKKKNVFDDFIAAAQWLIDNKYTSPDKLAIRGGSNGGLLVGAAMTQRPELFGAAIPSVGVMDMLRYHNFTIGWAWVSEYGSSDDAAAFKTLLSYSPLHNLQPGTSYPPTLVTTADHDDRVVPAHSFKFAAELQHAHQGDNPVLIRIETRAGHGAGTPTVKLIEASADVLAFLTKVLDD
ncbi:MAG: prolyl oligopeptidase family serine peptidase [Planctomycetota bacterium]|nr:prolyl oligopeptidase family serine peptidase [Planctomycetota bacterium]